MQIVQKKRKGLFLSIELVSVLIILSTLFATLVAGLGHMMNVHQVYKISKEYEEYSQAIVSFRAAFGAYPGDLSSASFSGTLNQANMQQNYNMLITSTQTTSYSALFSSPETNHIDNRKAQLAFTQMSLAGFINNKVDISYQISNACMGYSNLIRNIIPVTDYTNYGSWTIGMDSQNTSSGDNNSPKSSDIYNSSLYTNFANKPRLILFRYSGISTCTIDVTAGNAGLVSGVVSEMLDEKIDDGFPNSKAGILHADQQNLTGKCKALPTGSTSILDNKYVNSRANSGDSGCVLTFVVK